MGHMVGMPLPHIIDPMMNPMNFALVQLVLTIPVMIIGYRFYYVGTKNLIKLSPNMDSLITVGTIAAFIVCLVLTKFIMVIAHMRCIYIMRRLLLFLH